MPGNPVTDPQWPADLADTVEQVVGAVRDKATRPVVKASRAVVLGLFAAFVGVTAVVMLLVLSTRLIQDLLDIVLPRERAVYISYFAIGGILCLAGVLVYSRRTSDTA
jgi:hypothetical protein